jgi:AAA+ superfamily predicted ATPase
MIISIENMPKNLNEADKSIFNSRIVNAINDMLLERYHIEKPKLNISVSDGKKEHPELKKEETEKEEKINLPLQDPQFTFDQLVLEEKVIEELQYSIKFESVRDKIYNLWGLKKIDPSPKIALNFHGESGTGKTMAAQALANVMGKKIILASYAEIESKYHGDGPKNVKKLFQFAMENNAVLFIDEADSLLSKRLTNVTQGSEQAINSMRSQLLIEIEKFTGIIIFATNLAVNYDSAFITRIKSIYFKKPDKDMRKKLWDKMLLDSLPLDLNINADQLASIEDVCGRDIKNAVVKAAIKTAIDENSTITQNILEESIQDIIKSNKEIGKNSSSKLSDSEKIKIEEKIKRKIRKDKIRKKRHLFI